MKEVFLKVNFLGATLTNTISKKTDVTKGSKSFCTMVEIKYIRPVERLMVKKSKSKRNAKGVRRSYKN